MCSMCCINMKLCKIYCYILIGLVNVSEIEYFYLSIYLLNNDEFM